MKPQILLVAAGLIAGLPVFAHAKIERVVEKQFTVTPGGLLKVETQGGNIKVTSAPGNDVKVIARERFRTSDEKEADEIAQSLSVKIEQSGADVSAIAKYEGRRGFSLHTQWPPVEVEFEVTVPDHYRADLRTSGGNVSVSDLAGDVYLRTSGGNVTLGKIDGAIDAHSSGGNISVAEAMRTLKLDTSGGNISVDRAGGDAQVNTSGGNIHLGSMGGAVHASTSGGAVSAEFDDRIAGDSVLKTSGGNISVKVSPKAAFRVDASTSGGSVTVSGLTLEVERGGNGKSKVVGNVLGGGPVLTLNTSGGDVHVKAN